MNCASEIQIAVRPHKDAQSLSTLGPMMDRWVGKVAVVTGASSGIGAAVTMRLLKAGVLVVGLARRFDRLQALSAIDGSRGKLYPMRCDLSKEEELVDAFKWVNTELGGVDILVNNAGVGGHTKIIDDNAASFRKILDVNVLATAMCLREAVASMRSRDVPGQIININSILGHAVPSVKLMCSLYPPSKYAVTALTEVVRRELTTDPNNKIKITSLSPGLVKTEIHLSSGFLEETCTAIFNKAPYLDPDDIADAVLYVLGTRDNVQLLEEGSTLKPGQELFFSAVLICGIFSHSEVASSRKIVNLNILATAISVRETAAFMKSRVGSGYIVSNK